MRGLAVRPARPVTPVAAVPGQMLSRSCERLLDGVVAVLCTWTLVYHLCLVLRLGVAWAVGLEVAALAAWGALAWRSHRVVRSAPDVAAVTPEVGTDPAPWGRVEKALARVVVGAGGVAAVLVALDTAWVVVAAAWLVAAIAGTVLAVRRLRPMPMPVPARATGTRADTRVADTRVAVAWATVLGVLAMFTRWPNPDDLYYVNLSQWVVDHGTFPLRDTIFSDLVYPMSSRPPVASFDGLAGTVASLAGVPAASVVYLVVPPVATFLAVLALWRLLRAWRVAPLWLALSIALVFLLFDGGPGYAAPGNLFLTRLWQGKVVLLCLMVPLLLVYALRYVDRPTRARAGWLLAGGVAAVGLSTTAMFVVPLLAAAGAAPLARRRPRQALTGFAAMAAYPLAAGLVTLAVGGRSADFFSMRRLFRFEPSWFGHETFRDGPIALIAVAAVLGAVLLLPHRSARVTTGLLVTAVGVTLVPGVTQLSFALVGLGPTLWRVSWVATVAALVGVLGVWLTTRWRRRRTQVGVLAALVAALVFSGLPIWSPDTGVTLDTRPHWKRGLESIATAEGVIAAADPGDVVLAPEQLAITITVLTTRVKTVAPRDYFMAYLRDEPEFQYDERLTLVDFVNLDAPTPARDELASALDMLDVQQVCLPPERAAWTSFVRSLGYQRAIGSAQDNCLAR